MREERERRERDRERREREEREKREREKRERREREAREQTKQKTENRSVGFEAAAAAAAEKLNANPINHSKAAPPVEKKQNNGEGGEAPYAPNHAKAAAAVAK